MNAFNSYYIFLLIATFFFSCTHDTEPLVNNTNGEVYNCAYRPQIHFSSKYNWINDPNGLCIFRWRVSFIFPTQLFGRVGLYELGTCCKYWLNSLDTIECCIEARYTWWCSFSGSVVIDKNNTAGFGENAMVAIYTSAGSSQAQSNCFQHR